MRNIDLSLSLLVMSFWFWNQGVAGLVKWVGKYILTSHFWKSMARIGIIFSLNIRSSLLVNVGAQNSHYWKVFHKNSISLKI